MIRNRAILVFILWGILKYFFGTDTSEIKRPISEDSRYAAHCESGISFVAIWAQVQRELRRPTYPLPRYEEIFNNSLQISLDAALGGLLEDLSFSIYSNSYPGAKFISRIEIKCFLFRVSSGNCFDQAVAGYQIVNNRIGVFTHIFR